MTGATLGTTPRRTVAGRVGALGWRRPWLRGAALLTPPLAWFVLVYLASLVVLLVTAFWSVDVFTSQIVHAFTLDNFRTVFDNAAYRSIIVRTVGIAAAVTVTDAVLALPFAYFMARVAGPRLRTALFAAVLLPLWASYLARVYAWLLILNNDGALNWALRAVHLPTVTLAYSNTAMWLVFSYIWLPFMILPIYAAFERIPPSYLEASADLGARGGRTVRKVVLPLVLPGVAAGSVFTFSLTLGDYVTPLLIGGAGSNFIGNVVYQSVGVANNIPFAAALATVPIGIMAVYLLAAKRLGAFDAL
jgi:putative spermidine/putrescine transport system permease protein